MREEWRVDPGNMYMVSSHGRVYSFDRLVRTKAASGKWSYRRLKGRILRMNLSPFGYYRVNYGGQPKHVHRMVAEIFVPNPDMLETVNHIDGNKLNNRVDNLEWLSNSENVSHAWRTGLCVHEKKVRCIDTGVVYSSLREAARTYGLYPGNLTPVLRNQERTFGGHRWEYFEPSRQSGRVNTESGG